MPLPTFLMAGVQKAGTSSIYKYLEQHPQVCLGTVKEPDFLQSELTPEKIASKPTYYEKRAFRYSYEKYLENFSECTGKLAIGDGSVNCLFHYKTSIPRIQKYIPDAQIFVVLRHPIERAFSDYLMHLRDAINSQQTLPLVQQSPSSFQLRKGLYYESVKSFQETFGREKFRVDLYDDFCQDSSKMMKNIYEFIGVSTDFEADTSQKYQSAAIPKNPLVNRLLRKDNPLKTAFNSTIGAILPQEKRQEIRSWLISKNSQSKESVSLSPEDRQVLLDYYREDILKLQDYLDRDLSAWLK